MTETFEPVGLRISLPDIGLEVELRLDSAIVSTVLFRRISPFLELLFDPFMTFYHNFQIFGIDIDILSTHYS